MVELRIMEKHTVGEWDKIVEESTYGTIFHTISWMSILEEVYKIRKMLVGIFDDDILIGILPIFIQKKGIFRVASSPLLRATPYGGPLVNSSLIEDVIREFAGFLDEHRISFVDIYFPLGFVCKKAFEDANYNCENRYTYILDLDRDIEQIWDGLHKNCRNAIRRARKKGVEIVEADDIEYFDEYYKMAVDTYKKQGQAPTIPKIFFYRLWEVFRQKKQLKVLFAKYNNQLVAGAIFPQFKDVIYYWDGVSYPKYYKVAPNNLIQWSLIEWAVENNFKRYDMLGANIPNIARFKASFGGKLVEYLHAYKSKSKLVSLSKAMFERTIPTLGYLNYKVKK